MTTLEFLLDLRRLGVDVWLEGDRIKCSAPAGVLTDERREELARRKDTIHALLAAASLPLDACAIPIQPHGPGLPVFAVPGHNGDVFCFMGLARHLGNAQPFYGLQPPGLEGSTMPLENVEALADYFIEAIRRVQPRGPYQIAGYCLGGLAAFEMAQRLSAHGHEVSLLALFGTVAPTALTPFNWNKAALEYWLAERATSARSFLAASGPERISRVRRKASRVWSGIQPPAMENDPQAVRKRGLEDATIAAARRYRARHYQGRLTMFVPNRLAVRTADRPLDWRRYAADFEMCFGPDTCNGDTMLREQGVAEVARQLLPRLGAGAPPVMAPS